VVPRVSDKHLNKNVGLEIKVIDLRSCKTIIAGETQQLIMWREK
jgi:hypothetical protein